VRVAKKRTSLAAGAIRKAAELPRMKRQVLKRLSKVARRLEAQA
jgi:hypothetical protein